MSVKQELMHPSGKRKQAKADPVSQNSASSRQVEQVLVDPTLSRLTPEVVVSLQRTLGNRFVQRLISQAQHRSPPSAPISHTGKETIQRNKHDNLGDFVAWIATQVINEEYDRAYSRYPGLSPEQAAGQCSHAARDIGAFLTAQAFPNVEYRGILVFHQNHRGEQENLNHFVVIVTVAGQRIVVDPTQQQFVGGAPMIAPEAAWLSRFAGLQVRAFNGERLVTKTLPMKYQDFDTFEGANGYAGNRGVTFSTAGGTVLIPCPEGNCVIL